MCINQFSKSSFLKRRKNGLNKNGGVTMCTIQIFLDYGFNAKLRNMGLNWVNCQQTNAANLANLAKCSQLFYTQSFLDFKNINYFYSIY